MDSDAPAGTRERLRALPSVDELCSRPFARPLAAVHGRALVVEAARAALTDARRRLTGGEVADVRAVPDEAEVVAALHRLTSPKLRRVLNATGVVLHTNLGRAPLAREALARVADVARGYSTLELELDTGRRGSRQAGLATSLAALTGAEAALAVNNCAAALLLALSALARDREVITSRGELVEIGGGFRIPEVLAQSGARLVEVGTTNRTRAADYAAALTPATGLLLKVHRSNFALVGFSEEATIPELAALSRKASVPLVYDLGSGELAAARAALADGADLVCFSGDKVLGGPQAGVVVGRSALVERLARHPLARAVRIDKLCAAALEGTLQLYRAGREDAVPARRMLSEGYEPARLRAERLRALLADAGVHGDVVATAGKVGGGAEPLRELPSAAVRLSPGGAGALMRALRGADVPVIAVVRDGAVLLDVKALSEEDLADAARSVASALRSSAASVDAPESPKPDDADPHELET